MLCASPGATDGRWAARKRLGETSWAEHPPFTGAARLKGGTGTYSPQRNIP